MFLQMQIDRYSMKTNHFGIAQAWLVATLLLTACGGGATTPTPATSPTTYSIGGTLNGLAAGNTITFANGVDNMTLTADGAFNFPTKLANGSAYNLSIVRLPINQPCAYTYGAGTVTGSNAININLFCGPASVGSFVSAGSLSTARHLHTATLLQNGKVLVSGGNTSATGAALASSELYDPTTNTWAAVGSLATARLEHTATLLPDGKVLVVGGKANANVSNSQLTSAELYDPLTNAWSPAGLPSAARSNHTSTLLPNGKVLVAGGETAGLALNNAELYDSTTNTWTTAGILNTSRKKHTATLLPNGKVLVAGGLGNGGIPLSSTELYDPFTNSWSGAGSLYLARDYHTATLLPNGKVLVVGGFDTVFPVNITELFDPATNTWMMVQSSKITYLHTATLLPTGKVLVPGGNGGTSALVSVGQYDPVTNTWAGGTGLLATARWRHTDTLLSNGTLLVVGGMGSGGIPLSSAELYW